MYNIQVFVNREYYNEKADEPKYYFPNVNFSSLKLVNFHFSHSLDIVGTPAIVMEPDAEIGDL